MCLFVENPIPNVAEKPIKVYKLLLHDKIRNQPDVYRFVCQGGVVNIGETVKASKSNYQRLSWYGGAYAIEGEGVHGYIAKKDALNTGFYYDIITEWEIPVGAKYWVGNTHSKGEIAATEMKFIKVCEKQSL